MSKFKASYDPYQSIKESGREKWIAENDDIPFDELVKIISYISDEDMEHLSKEFYCDYRVIIHAIYDMGLNKFIELKANNQLDDFMNYEHYRGKVNIKEEYNWIKQLCEYDIYDQYREFFYIHHYFINNFDEERINLLIEVYKDKFRYIDGKVADKNTGYKWYNEIAILNACQEIKLLKKTNPEKIVNLRDKLGVPLNVLLLGVAKLRLTLEEADSDDIEKLIANFYKFNLNTVSIINEGDCEHIKEMLRSLPDDLDSSYETVIKQCLGGKFRKFNIRTFEELQNYQQICDEKILQEFDKEDVNEIRNTIMQTKVNDLDGLKRDLYFYKKYLGEQARENRIYNLFTTLLESNDKEKLLDAYKSLNESSEGFEWDSLIKEIKESLKEVSRDDVVSKMAEMKSKIGEAKTKSTDGAQVVDLTGTDFNLLLSVIGATGSPYLVEHYNNIIAKQIPSRRASQILIKQGQKRLLKQRYRYDPLKNKQRCVSSIDEDFLGHIPSLRIGDETKQVEEKLILAYFPTQKEDIHWMGLQDLMTIYDKDRGDASRRRVPHRDNLQGVCNLKLQDLNSSTLGSDNELVIDSYPGAVVCFGNVSKVSKKTAQKLGVPILYIDPIKQMGIMKEKLHEYYQKAHQIIIEEGNMSEENFQKVFNILELDNNIIHRAFKMVNSFTFMDFDDYPKGDVIEVFEKMKDLLREGLKRCNTTQKEEIKSTMLKEEDLQTIRYGRYYKFIDFKELTNMVMAEEATQEPAER